MMTMRKIDPGVWDIIEDACKIDGLNDVRRDYISRGASARESCIGAVGSDYGDAVQFMVNVVEGITGDIVNSPSLLTEQKNWLILMAKDMKTDGMGKKVIYYFPGWIVSDD